MPSSECCILSRRLKMARIAGVLDFGCGTGTATPDLLRGLGAQSVLGIDVSTESLDEASAICGPFRQLSRVEQVRAKRRS